MVIVEPTRFSKLNAESFEEGGYMSSQKSRMDFLLKNGHLTPSAQALKDAVATIREEAGIVMSPAQAQAMLSLFPEARVTVSEYGSDDTEARGLLLNAVAGYLAGTRWPENRDEVEIDDFVRNLHVAARFMGFATVKPE